MILINKGPFPGAANGKRNMKKLNSEQKKPSKLDRLHRGGFTLIELLVVIAIIAILASMILPSLGKAKQKTQGVYCMNNARQMMIAWSMYAHDAGDKLVPAFHGGMATGGNFDANIGPGWCEGWLDWSASTDNTNINFLISDKYSRLAQYIAKSKNIFKCPADTYLSPAQRGRGWKERCRSLSGNIGIGDGNAEAGPWDSAYRHIKKYSQFNYPGPDGTWVYVDEHPDSINDSGFFNPHAWTWADMPSAYHNGACGFSFADGHAEIHKWKASLASPRAFAVKYTDGSDMPGLLGSKAGDVDIRWMNFHAGRNTPNTF
jgi:prepilin-type N-terminal cleavage/methylation domain-containing protein/prepilin-type processing-associated H-X9-DG protein